MLKSLNPAIPRRHMRRTSLFDIINTVLMVVFMIVALYPFYYCIILSFNVGKDALIPGIYLWPRKFTLDNYRFIFLTSNFSDAIRNSVLRTVIGTVLHLTLTSMASYGLYRMRFYKRVYLVYFVITMYFGGGLIPTYLIIRSLGMIDTFSVYVIPGMWSFFHALLFMTYFRTIPDSLHEQAYIDGAGPFRTLYTIILPLSKPVLATVALFVAVGQWNSFFDTMLYTSSDSLITLQYLLMKLIRQAEYIDQMLNSDKLAGLVKQQFDNAISPVTIRMATMLIVVTPIICVYPFLQKYFVKGVMIGAIKG